MQDEFKKEFQKIASAWNGEDTTFYLEGVQYKEADAQQATEIVEECEKLEEMINEFNRNGEEICGR